MSIMKRNAQLVEATTYTDDYGDWFLKLVYTYNDDKGKHEVIFPKVDLPFNQYSIPYYISDQERGEFIDMANAYQYEINYAMCHVRKGIVANPLTNEKLDPCTMADILVEPKVHEMTLEEVEKKLVYKVKIVSDKGSK